MPWFVGRWGFRRWVLLLWLLLMIWGWPQVLGGANAYVVVKSESMRPLLRRGDLVVVRRSTVYRTGDIALYRSQKVGLVLHRIIGYTPQGEFLFQGDANDYVDPERPTREDILGRYLFHLPWLGWPFLLWGQWFPTFLLVLAVLWYFWPEEVPGRRQRWWRRA